MAKISTYPLDGSPNLGDKLIGTDIDNQNATKNLTVGQILSVPGSSTYVPYTGANANVNLGLNSITANSFVRLGGLSTQFLKADGSVDSNTYVTTATLSLLYVPYTGATGNVNLGNNDLEADNLTANVALYTNEWRQIGSNSMFTYDSSGQSIGLAINYGQQKVRLGDFNGFYSSTELSVDYNNGWVEVVGALRVNGGVGSAGQVLISQGSGLPPQWGPSPLTVPSLQQVLNFNKDLVNGRNYQGTNAGTGNTGNQVAAIGETACLNNTGNFVIGFGFGCSGFNTGNNVIGIGINACGANSGAGSIGIGNLSANANQGIGVIAIGNGACNGIGAFGAQTGNNVIGIGLDALGGNKGNNVIGLGNNAGEGNTLNGMFIISNDALPSYVNHAAAVTAISLAGIAGNTYIYHNQSTDSIGAVRL